MADTTLPTADYIRQILAYSEGGLFWLSRPLAHFKNAHGCNIWNAKNSGRRAGCMAGHYRAIRIDGRRFLEHRLVWLWHFGDWPEHEIDHINGNKLDNRVENLRNVTRQENAKNLPVRNAKHGVPGVRPFGARWRASISHGDVTVYLGTFDDYASAVTARRDAERKYGFHENHGRE